jgi:predicted Zn-dependent peptidase
MEADFQVFQVAGVPVCLREWSPVRSVSAGVWFRVGGRYEPAPLSGASHFIEHMLFKGTRTRSARDITRAVESRGGDMNAFTSEEMTCYYGRLADRHCELLFDVLLDMVRNSTFDRDELERERKVIQEEIRMYDDQPSMVAAEWFNRTLWPSHPLGRPVTGTLDTVGAVSRRELTAFWKSHYGPGAMFITVAGNIGRDEVVRMLTPRLGPIRKAVRWRPPVPVPAPRRTRPQVVSVQRQVQQLNFCLGVPTFGRDDRRRHALRILSVLLGENMSSRLFQSLRERHGLAYSVQTVINQFRDTGSFSVHVGLEGAQLEKSLGIIMHEFGRLRERPVSKVELARAKEYAIGQFELNMESVASQMLWSGEMLAAYGKMTPPGKILEELAAVSVEDIRNLARAILVPGRMVLAAVGPEPVSRAVARRWS